MAVADSEGGGVAKGAIAIPLSSTQRKTVALLKSEFLNGGGGGVLQPHTPPSPRILTLYLTLDEDETDT